MVGTIITKICLIFIVCWTILVLKYKVYWKQGEMTSHYERFNLNRFCLFSPRFTIDLYILVSFSENERIINLMFVQIASKILVGKLVTFITRHERQPVWFQHRYLVLSHHQFHRHHHHRHHHHYHLHQECHHHHQHHQP